MIPLYFVVSLPLLFLSRSRISFFGLITLLGPDCWLYSRVICSITTGLGGV